jgi:serine protease Do
MFTKRYTYVASLMLVAALPAGTALTLMHTTQSVAQSSPVIVKGLPDFTELVELVGPSVVNIRTTEKIPVRGGGQGGNPFGGMDKDMLEFFRRFGIPVPNVPSNPRGTPNPTPQAPQEIERQRGVGSGFILSADGFIMTNAHVVEGATDVLVTLTDKREFKAKIIGADKRTDVAVVKIEAIGLPAVKLGDVAKLKVGEWVMAIGSPFGLENSVTAGIVSAKARDTGEFLPFIQTDVAINPGNSGGPLINMRGEVVGINSQIVTRSGGYNGVSLAIPIDEAKRVADQLQSGGRVARGRIGVEAGAVSLELAESLGLSKAQGALVGRVVEDSPAAKANVEPGDIILKFDGKPIDKSSDLPRAVGGTKPNTKTTISVYRRGKHLDLPITVAELEPEEAKSAKADKPANQGKAEKAAPPTYAAATNLGLGLGDLTDEHKKDLKLKAGARIESATGAAASAGLREGDVIVAISNVEVGGAKDAESVLAKQDKNKAIALQIRRGDRGNFVLFKPETKSVK